MVRRTKTEALATRDRLLDAAERLFQAQGVSGTSLAAIAGAAGTTRGAIYHHFRDKADLFNAMMARVTLPLESTLACAAESAPTAPDPLGLLRQSLHHALHQTVHDERTRRVFEVATHQVEYTRDMGAARERHLQVRNQCLRMTAAALQQASQRQGIDLALTPGQAALGLHVMIDGLIQNWLLDVQAFDLMACGRRTVDTYLRGLGLRLDPELPSDAAESP